MGSSAEVDLQIYEYSTGSLMIARYLNLVKFSHTIFAMPFAMVGFFLGVEANSGNTQKPLWLIFILVVLCMVFARSAAMAFNRWLDASYDALNPRTAIREIPAGAISKSSALGFVVFSSIAFVVSAGLINVLCLTLAPVALFAILFYSYTKRFTPLCHLVLGVGLSLAPIGAYLAVTGEFHLLPVLFSFVVLFWVSGFDIIYALQDEEFDKANNLRSIPAWLGKQKGLRVSELLHALAAMLVIFIGYNWQFGLWYWIGAAVFLLLLVYQHSLVKPPDLSKVDLAFFTTNGIGSVVFGSFVILELIVN
jgi:4-hydroxybenzoate polyprenyltransferase